MLPDKGDRTNASVTLTGIDGGGVDCTPDIGCLRHRPPVNIAVPKTIGSLPMIDEGTLAVENVDREGGNALAVHLESIVDGLCGGEDIRHIEAGLFKIEGSLGGVVTAQLAFSHQKDDDGIVVERIAVLKLGAGVCSVRQIPHASHTAGATVGKPYIATIVVVDILAADTDAGFEVARNMKVHDKQTVGAVRSRNKDGVAVVVGEENSVPSEGHIVGADHGVEIGYLITVDEKSVVDNAVATVAVGSGQDNSDSVGVVIEGMSIESIGQLVFNDGVVDNGISGAIVHDSRVVEHAIDISVGIGQRNLVFVELESVAGTQVGIYGVVDRAWRHDHKVLNHGIGALTIVDADHHHYIIFTPMIVMHGVGLS